MADFYVSTTGSDSNTGTKDSPFRTILKASQAATAGSTVHVAPGTYQGGFQTTKSDITYVSDVKWGAKIVPGSNNSRIEAWDNRGSNVTIDGFEIDGSGQSAGTRWLFGVYTTGSNSVVQNMKVHDIVRDTTAWNAASTGQGGAGIMGDGYYGGSNIKMLNNTVYNIGPAGKSSSLVHGVYMATSGEVKGNLIYQVVGDGVTTWHDATNLKIVNNTIFEAHGAAIMIGAGDFYRSSAPHDYSQVSNNILYANTKGVEMYGQVGTHNTFTNNLVYGNGTNWSLKNATHTGTISADPKFVNYIATGGGDYRLAAGSPAIDAGTSTNAPTYDLNGLAREGAVDIGAYEFRSAASPTAPPAVPALPAPPSSPARGTPKDFDGDHRADILWFNDQTRQIALWSMDGGTRTDAAVIQNAVSSEWNVVGTGDVNGDARTDILFRHNGTGDLAVWTMDGAARTAGMVVQGGGLPVSTRVAGVADLNGDGMADLVLHDASGDVGVWLMDGVTRASVGMVQRAVNPVWAIAGTGDFDGDGRADILWQRADTGAVAVWTMNGTTRLDGQVAQDAVNAAWTIQCVGDLNGDGKDDIVWRHTDGQLAAWLMNGAARLDAGTLDGGPLSGEWGIADAADFDGNGTADLLLRNGVTGGTAVWLMNGMTRTGEATIQASGAAGWQVVSGYPHQTVS